MVRNGNEFARALLRREHESMKAKEHAAKRMYNALEDLRKAAGELRVAVTEYCALDQVTRRQLAGLLGMTPTELRIAFDAKQELVAANRQDDEARADPAGSEDAVPHADGSLAPAVPDAPDVPPAW